VTYPQTKFHNPASDGSLQNNRDTETNTPISSSRHVVLHPEKQQKLLLCEELFTA
jgi:hypothetical protein